MPLALNPRKPIKPLAEQIESVNTCCLREDNLYVAEYVNGSMVRKCRRCHHKHYTMKADLGAIFRDAARTGRQRRRGITL